MPFGKMIGAGCFPDPASPGSQSLAAGYIPSPHAGLCMGRPDRRRRQMCYAPRPATPRVWSPCWGCFSIERFSLCRIGRLDGWTDGSMIGGSESESDAVPPSPSLPLSRSLSPSPGGSGPGSWGRCAKLVRTTLSLQGSGGGAPSPRGSGRGGSRPALEPLLRDREARALSGSVRSEPRFHTCSSLKPACFRTPQCIASVDFTPVQV